MSTGCSSNRDGREPICLRLIKEELSPYCELDEKRASIEGPDLLLEPDMAQAIAVTVHELTTNAAKYGALSVPEGRVQIAWSCEPDARVCSAGPRPAVRSSSRPIARASVRVLWKAMIRQQVMGDIDL